MADFDSGRPVRFEPGRAPAFWPFSIMVPQF